MSKLKSVGIDMHRGTAWIRSDRPSASDAAQSALVTLIEKTLSAALADDVTMSARIIEFDRTEGRAVLKLELEGLRFDTKDWSAD